MKQKIDSKNNKLTKDFVLTVDYSKEDNDVFISKDRLSGEKYDCNCLEDLINAIKKFYQDNLLDLDNNKQKAKMIER